MLGHSDFYRNILELLSNYYLYLYVLLAYYLIKNRGEWQKMSYQLFATSFFFSIISICRNLLPVTAETFFIWLYVGNFYVLYGIIAYFLENDKKPHYNMSIWQLLLVTIFSLGIYIPIWIMKKYKQYNIGAKYFWLVLVYLYLLQLYYNNFLLNNWGDIFNFKNYQITKLLIIVLMNLWSLGVLFFLQNEIEKKSKVIQFKEWYFTLLFGIFYIQYKINDEIKFFKKKEQNREALAHTAHYTS